MRRRLDRLVARTIRKSWPPERVQKYVGTYQGCYFTYASDPALRRKAASGGSTTALLGYLLSSDQIDGALVCRTEVNENGQLRPYFIIAETMEQLISAQGSKYIAVYFAAQAFPLIRGFPGRLAVVGLPCDITILQRARSTDPAIARKVVLTIALLCGHNSEPELTDGIIERLRPEGRPLTAFSYRSGHWRGELTAEFAGSAPIVKPFSHFSDYQNLYFFSQRKCHHCFDHTGYHADLSAGDIWSLRMRHEPIKHTALIPRTEAASRFVVQALEKGVLTGRPEPIDEVCEGQARTMPFHYNVSARSVVGRVLGERIKDAVQENVQIWDYIVAWMVLLNERLTRTSLGRRTALSIPRPILKLSLYLMKLLESLSREAEAITGRPVVGIIGGTVWGNRGAESMLATTTGRVKEMFRDATFRVFSYSPKKDRSLVQRDNIKVLSSTPQSLTVRLLPFALFQWLARKLGGSLPGWLLTRVAREMRTCDVLLDIGGISFVDGREIYLPFNIMTIWPAMLMGVPVVKLAQAMGPFRNPINRAAARLFLPRCEHVFARGQSTFQHLQDLGLKNVSRVADIAFLYQPEYSLSNENEERVTELETVLKDMKSGGQRLIGMAPSTVMWERHGNGYLDAMVKLVLELSASDTHFVFLANATREGSTRPRNNDLVVLRTLENNLRAALPAADLARTHWALWDVNTRSLRRLIAVLDLLITSRFHAMVSALSLRVPVLVIGWSHKYAETLQDFGLQRYAADFNAEGPDLTAMAHEILQNADGLRQQIGETLAGAQASAAGQFAHLKSVLK